MTGIIDTLLKSDEPSVRWKVRTLVLGEDPDSPGIRTLRAEIRRSSRARALIDGQAAENRGTYVKWTGRHWVLISLADLGYPPGDPELVPVAEKTMKTWLAPTYFAEYETNRRETGRSGVPVMRGRHRRCASQQGGALLAAVRLGLVPDDADRLVERLLHWQWPDGGWNCDRRPEAESSSVGETLLAMRGLAAYARDRNDQTARVAAEQAAEVFLTRRLLFHRGNGTPIRDAWFKLNYPSYWYYDVLSATKGLLEVGRLDDPRAQDGLDVLERKRLPDGGWPAEARHYRSSGQSGIDLVGWGGISASKSNEWITADALAVMAAAGRL
jgi:hypothetical protein